MNQKYKQNCVLCDEPTDYHFADKGKRKQFDCPNCSVYEITDTAEDKLKAKPESWKVELSNKAMSCDNKILSIFVPNTSSSSGAARKDIDYEYTMLKKDSKRD